MRKIIHVDMDCFYASVETKHNPEYRGKPLGVGGPPNSRSVLCTANYEARKFGVKAAIPSSRAVRLCPQLILVPPRFDLYKEESRAIREIFHRFTDKIEPLSLDEAYLDVTDCKEFHGSATAIAREIRKMIWYERGLTASAGIAENKFLAKIASDWRKPNNQFTIAPNEVEAFMPSLPIECIYGVGKVTAEALHKQGLFTCGDIQALSQHELKRIFGNRAQDMFELSRGVDHRDVCCRSERKSLTVEETYSKDLRTWQEVSAVIPELFEDWSRRMSKGHQWNHMNGWVVKLKFFDFKSTTHEVSRKTKPELQDFVDMLQKVYAKNDKPVRLVGLGARLKESEAEANSLQLSLDQVC